MTRGTMMVPPLLRAAPVVEPGRPPRSWLKSQMSPVALSIHQALQCASDPTSLQQTPDTVGRVTIVKSRRGRCGGREGTCPNQLEAGDMEGWTDPHRPGKLETIGDWVDATQVLDWSYVAWS